MDTYDAKYWNSKWPTSPIIYSGRALRGKKENIGIDVRAFILTNDAILQETIKKYKLIKPTHDEIAWECQKFIVKFASYKDDTAINQCPEFWQFPFESIQSGTGDCEDMAILMASLMINCGIPSYKVKVAAGYVRESPTAPQGGHAYCIYLASDNNWRIMDWCYFEDSTLPVLQKPLAKDGGYNKCYQECWFTFNNEFSWNQTSLEITATRISNNRTALLEEVAQTTNLDRIMEGIETQYRIP
jgi:hypothetical protein